MYTLTMVGTLEKNVYLFSPVFWCVSLLILVNTTHTVCTISTETDYNVVKYTKEAKPDSSTQIDSKHPVDVSSGSDSNTHTTNREHHSTNHHTAKTRNRYQNLASSGVQSDNTYRHSRIFDDVTSRNMSERSTIFSNGDQTMPTVNEHLTISSDLPTSTNEHSAIFSNVTATTNTDKHQTTFGDSATRAMNRQSINFGTISTRSLYRYSHVTNVTNRQPRTLTPYPTTSASDDVNIDDWKEWLRALETSSQPTRTTNSRVSSTSKARSTTEKTVVDQYYHRYKTISADEISSCLEKKSSIHTKHEAVVIDYIQVRNNMAWNSDAAGTCKLTVSNLYGAKMFHMLIEEQTCSTSNWLSLSLPDHTRLWDGCTRWLSPGSDYVTSFPRLTVRIVVSDFRSAYRLKVSIHSVFKPRRKQVERLFVHSHLGYFQSPNFDADNTKKFYKHDLDSHVYVNVLDDHSTVATVAHVNMRVFDYCFHHTDAFVILCADQRRLWARDACNSSFDEEDEPSTRVVHQAKILSVHFKVDDGRDCVRRFRILFYFINKTELLGLTLPNDKWNCSHPRYLATELRRMFICNLKTECWDGQDEDQCIHTLCGQSGVRVHGACFFLTRSSPLQATAYNARTACTNKGGRLAVLSTVDKWLQVPFQMQLDRQGKKFYLALTSAPSQLPHMYRYALVWQGSSVAYYANHHTVTYSTQCAHSDLTSSRLLAIMDDCNKLQPGIFNLCELPSVNARNSQPPSAVSLARAASQSVPVPQVKCPSGHMTLAFLACDVASACWRGSDVSFSKIKGSWGMPSRSSCPADLTFLPPSFLCAGGGEHVPYSMVCDRLPDCLDHSDERFCQFPACRDAVEFSCRNSQCVPLLARCDDIQHCHDGSDEEGCERQSHSYKDVKWNPPPGLVTFDGRGNFTITSANVGPTVNNGSQCPETHFQCPGDGYCLPVFLRCNGVLDCPGHEDELACENYECPGFFRCRGFLGPCLHAMFLCDGWPQCPQHDDELFCNVRCPPGCTCLGLSFTCRTNASASFSRQLRYLDAGGSGLDFNLLTVNKMLIHLSLSRCGVKSLQQLPWHNLHSLDLSDNLVNVIRVSHLQALNSLQVLFLSNNPIKYLFAETLEDRSNVSHVFKTVGKLDMSGTGLSEINSAMLKFFPNVLNLNFSYSGLEVIAEDTFIHVPKLEVLNLEGCPLTNFPIAMFQNLQRLRQIYTSHHRVCCAATLIDSFVTSNCKGKGVNVEEMSCQMLLASNVHRVGWSVLASVMILANGCMVLIRLAHKTSNRSTVDMLVTHMFIPGCFLAMYMAVIVVADRVYEGSYLWKDHAWRNSGVCRGAGVVWVTCTYVSFFLLTIITGERLQAVWSPVTSVLFSKTSAYIVCVTVWIMSCAIALVPFLTTPQHRNPYGETGMCSSFLISITQSSSQRHLHEAMSLVHLALSLVPLTGQVFIYVRIRRSDVPSVASLRKNKELVLARRLVLLVTMESLCWAVVGVSGLLAPDHMNQVSGVLSVGVFPVHFTLKPVLFLCNVLMERGRMERQQRLMKMLLARSKRPPSD